MIIPLLQPTDHDYRNSTITVLDENRHTATMNRIVLCRLAQPHLSLELFLVTFKLILQTPSAGVEANDSSPFTGYPEVIV